MEKSELLVYLAEKGAVHKEIELSTTLISKDLESSQQTISRKLMELEDSGLIKRSASTRGVKIFLTQEGMEFLQKKYVQLKSVFTNKKESVKGIVETGLKEGAYYMSLDGYVKQFKKKLDIDPYPGTLNLRVDYNDFLQFIIGREKILIDRFETKERTFGRIDTYKVKIDDIPSALIIPKRTSHDKNVVEIISKTFFRGKLKLKDGDEVVIE